MRAIFPVDTIEDTAANSDHKAVTVVAKAAC